MSVTVFLYARVHIFILDGLLCKVTAQKKSLAQLRDCYVLNYSNYSKVS